MTIRTSARPRAGWLSRLLVGLIAVGLTGLGLGTAAPAMAATSTLTGTGPGQASTTLDTGLYEATLTYGGNDVGDGPTLFGALLNSDNGSVLELLAVDVKSDNSTRKIVQIFTETSVVFDVIEAAPDATWTLTLHSIDPADAVAMPSGVSGQGLNSSSLYRLNAGAYRLTTSFAGNVHAQGLEDFGFGLELYGVAGDDHTLVSSTAAHGSATTSFKVAKAGYYWFHPVTAAAEATWSVSIATLKQFTSTPTPKISGTVKVGKTLKAKPGTWKPSGVKLSYQWYRGSSKISKATKSSYKLTSKDKGKTIKVKVTGTKSGYLSVAKTSKATGKVK